MAVKPVPMMTDVPSFPALSDRAAGSYNSKAFAFATHMADRFNGELITVAENVLLNAAESEAQAQMSESASLRAAAAMQAAISVAGAAMWVSGTFIRKGASVIGPVDGHTYRKITEDSITTSEPSADPVNWIDLTAENKNAAESASAAASQAKAGAEAARDAAQLASGVFTNKSAGLSATTNGKYFTVPAEGSSESLILYQNSAGVAVEVTRYPAASAVETLEAEVSKLAYAVGYSGPLPIPTGATAVTSSNFVFADAATKSGKVNRIFLRSVSAGNLTVKIYARAGDVFTEQRSVVVPVVAGYQEISLALGVGAGEYIGFSGSGTVAYGGSIGAVSDGAGWYGGSGTSFTDTEPSVNVRLGIRFDIRELTRLREIESSISKKADAEIVSAIESDIYSRARMQVIGASGTIPAGNAALSGATLWALNNPVDIKTALRGTLSRFAYFASGVGTARIMVFARSGDTFAVKREQSIVVAGGYNETALDIPVEQGDYLGFQSSVIQQLTTSGDSAGWYGGPGVNSFTDQTLSTSSRLLVRFEVLYRERSASTTRPFSVDLPFENMLIIGAGQSLMEGSQTSSSGTSPITTSQEYDNMGFPAYPAVPDAVYPATVASTQRLSNRGEWPGLACAAAIRSALRRENNLTENDVKSTVVLANNAVGGSPIASLSKGTAPYSAAISQAAALANVTHETAGVLAVIFGQGESDGSTARIAYRDAMIKLAKDYDADLRAATGQAKRVPLVAYQLGGSSRDVALAQLDASLACSLVRIACPMYPFSYYDNVHIDSISARRLGAYYGEAVKALSIDGGEWEPLRPLSAQVLGNTITLTFNKSGLEFDTALIPAQANHGFFVKTAASTQVAINAVDILNGNQVRISCATAPAAGWVVQYGMTAVGKAPYVGRAGNLRDSAGAEKSFDGWPLHNFSVIFDWAL